MSDTPATPLRVTAEDLSRARLPDPPPAPARRTSQLAVASLVLALLGIPLVGVLLGPIAICCGIVAVGAIRRREGLTGFGLAVAGIAIGTLELVGWTVGLIVVLSRPVSPASGPAPVTAAARSVGGIAEAPAHIRRALQANALVRCRSPRAEALGSGVVVGGGGGAWLLLTNRHVVDCAEAGAATLTAATPGGAERPAAVAWRAPEDIDAVVLRVEGDGALPGAAALHAEAAPRVGDPVFVIGNPLGYEATYTAGVLSAMRTATWGPHRLRVFQVQASVNSGNSGGGLYDQGGHLIGLVTWTAAKEVAEGLGFAISTDELLALVRDGAPREVAALVGAGAGGGPKP